MRQKEGVRDREGGKRERGGNSPGHSPDERKKGREGARGGGKKGETKSAGAQNDCQPRPRFRCSTATRRSPTVICIACAQPGAKLHGRRQHVSTVATSCLHQRPSRQVTRLRVANRTVASQGGHLPHLRANAQHGNAQTVPRPVSLSIRPAVTVKRSNRSSEFPP